jgi:hypothetical protein
MPSYNYKLAVDAVAFSEFNHKEECEFMADRCRCSSHCTIGFLSCPFGKPCEDITAKDWMKVLVPSTENHNEQD